METEKLMDMLLKKFEEQDKKQEERDRKQKVEQEERDRKQKEEQEERDRKQKEKQEERDRKQKEKQEERDQKQEDLMKTLKEDLKKEQEDLMKTMKEDLKEDLKKEQEERDRKQEERDQKQEDLMKTIKEELKKENENRDKKQADLMKILRKEQEDRDKKQEDLMKTLKEDPKKEQQERDQKQEELMKTMREDQKRDHEEMISDVNQICADVRSEVQEKIKELEIKCRRVSLNPEHGTPGNMKVKPPKFDGLLSWDVNDCLVDLEKELATIIEQGLEGEEARYGERLIQFASENLVTEILIHPSVSTLSQCVRNLLSSFTRHRHIIHAGYTFQGNGSWALQDGTFSYSDFSEAFQEIEVQRVIHAYENGISIDLHCSPEGEWARLPKEYFTKSCKVRVNPTDVLTTGSPSITSFIKYLEPFLVPTVLEDILESSDVVGNIRFSRPTLYVFPGGQGDAALFGINGFNMLLDGGYSRKACFWDFVRHLDRLDAVLMTRLNNSNVSGISSVLKRKQQGAVYPQLGHFFCNIQERKSLLSPDGDKDRDPLIISLLEEGQSIIQDVKRLNLASQTCFRDSEPIILYHKVGHGTLNMYVLSPDKNSREVREFMQKWNHSDPKLFAASKTGKEFAFPLQNLVSICALLVWQPANPNDTITRILYPGSAPQKNILEGLDRIKGLECMKQPVCTVKSIMPVKKSKQDILDKIAGKDVSSKNIIGERKSEIKILAEDAGQKHEMNGDVVREKTVKKSDSIESDKEKRAKKVEDTKKVEENGKIIENGDKARHKPRVDHKSRARTESQQRKKPTVEKKGPSTPKKTAEEKSNGETKEREKRAPHKPSPQGTPAKSTKDANNRKVIESKKAPQKREPVPKPALAEKLKSKPERAPISRRPKTVKAPSSPMKKMGNGVHKPDSLTKRGKLDKEGTTDSSTVSTPSAEQESILKKDISKLTPEEIQQLKDKELEELKEEQDAVKEIEAVFRKGEVQTKESEPGLRKIKNISIEDNLEAEEYLIIEKEEVDHDSIDLKEDEMQKLTRDSEESEKQRKLSAEDIKAQTQETVEIQQKEEAKVKDLDAKKQRIISPEDKMVSSLEKKDLEEEVKEVVESHPEEKVSANIESGATTTAPTLPEDERITLDEIKEDIGKPIEEKHIKEETKEKEVPIIQLPPKSQQESHSKPPQIISGIPGLDKQRHIRDIVKTPDEVADLPVHEEADYQEYQEDRKTNEVEKPVEKKDGETAKTEGEEKPVTETRKTDDKKNEEPIDTKGETKKTTIEGSDSKQKEAVIEASVSEKTDDKIEKLDVLEKAEIETKEKSDRDNNLLHQDDELVVITKEDEENAKEVQSEDQLPAEICDTLKAKELEKEQQDPTESDLSDHEVRDEDEIHETIEKDKEDITALIEEADQKPIAKEVDEAKAEKVVDVLKELEAPAIKEDEQVAAMKESTHDIDAIDDKLQELKRESPLVEADIDLSKSKQDLTKIEEPSKQVDLKEEHSELTKIDDKMNELKSKTEEEEISIEKSTRSPEHAESVVLPDSSPEDDGPRSPFREFDLEKSELGRKSPAEREEDVKKIVVSVAEVLKSEKPLETFQGKLTFTQELRETHITTQDSPILEAKIILNDDIPPIPEEATEIDEDVRNSEIRPLKVSPDSEIIVDKDDDAGIVHRMLVTASSEDGGEEIEICPAGTITFSKSSESSGRSSPEHSQKTQSQKSSIVETLSDTMSTVKQAAEKSGHIFDSGVDEKVDDLEKQDMPRLNGDDNKVKTPKGDIKSENVKLESHIEQVSKVDAKDMKETGQYEKETARTAEDIEIEKTESAGRVLKDLEKEDQPEIKKSDVKDDDDTNIDAAKIIESQDHKKEDSKFSESTKDLPEKLELEQDSKPESKHKDSNIELVKKSYDVHVVKISDDKKDESPESLNLQGAKLELLREDIKQKSKELDGLNTELAYESEHHVKIVDGAQDKETEDHKKEEDSSEKPKDLDKTKFELERESEKSISNIEVGHKFEDLDMVKESGDQIREDDKVSEKSLVKESELFEKPELDLEEDSKPESRKTEGLHFETTGDIGHQKEVESLEKLTKSGLVKEELHDLDSKKPLTLADELPESLEVMSNDIDKKHESELKIDELTEDLDSKPTDERLQKLTDKKDTKDDKETSDEIKEEMQIKSSLLHKELKDLEQEIHISKEESTETSELSKQMADATDVFKAHAKATKEILADSTKSETDEKIGDSVSVKEVTDAFDHTKRDVETSKNSTEKIGALIDGTETVFDIKSSEKEFKETIKESATFDGIESEIHAKIGDKILVEGEVTKGFDHIETGAESKSPKNLTDKIEGAIKDGTEKLTETTLDVKSTETESKETIKEASETFADVKSETDAKADDGVTVAKEVTKTFDHIKADAELKPSEIPKHSTDKTEGALKDDTEKLSEEALAERSFEKESKETIEEVSETFVDIKSAIDANASDKVSDAKEATKDIDHFQADAELKASEVPKHLTDKIEEAIKDGPEKTLDLKSSEKESEDTVREATETFDDIESKKTKSLTDKIDEELKDGTEKLSEGTLAEKSSEKESKETIKKVTETFDDIKSAIDAKVCDIVSDVKGEDAESKTSEIPKHLTDKIEGALKDGTEKLAEENFAEKEVAETFNDIKSEIDEKADATMSDANEVTRAYDDIKADAESKISKIPANLTDKMEGAIRHGPVLDVKTSKKESEDIIREVTETLGDIKYDIHEKADAIVSDANEVTKALDHTKADSVSKISEIPKNLTDKIEGALKDGTEKLSEKTLTEKETINEFAETFDDIKSAKAGDTVSDANEATYAFDHIKIDAETKTSEIPTKLADKLEHSVETFTPKTSDTATDKESKETFGTKEDDDLIPHRRESIVEKGEYFIEKTEEAIESVFASISSKAHSILDGFMHHEPKDEISEDLVEEETTILSGQSSTLETNKDDQKIDLKIKEELKDSGKSSPQLADEDHTNISSAMLAEPTKDGDKKSESTKEDNLKTNLEGRRGSIIEAAEEFIEKSEKSLESVFSAVGESVQSVLHNIMPETDNKKISDMSEKGEAQEIIDDQSKATANKTESFAEKSESIFESALTAVEEAASSVLHEILPYTEKKESEEYKQIKKDLKIEQDIETSESLENKALEDKQQFVDNKFMAAPQKDQELSSSDILDGQDNQTDQSIDKHKTKNDKSDVEKKYDTVSDEINNIGGSIVDQKGIQEGGKIVEETPKVLKGEEIIENDTKGQERIEASLEKVTDDKSDLEQTKKPDEIKDSLRAEDKKDNETVAEKSTIVDSKDTSSDNIQEPVNQEPCLDIKDTKPSKNLDDKKSDQTDKTETKQFKEKSFKVDKDTLEKEKKQIEAEVKQLGESIDEISSLTQSIHFDKCHPKEEFTVHKISSDKEDTSFEGTSSVLDKFASSSDNKVVEKMSCKLESEEECKEPKETLKQEKEAQIVMQNLQELSHQEKTIFFDQCHTDESKVDKDAAEKEKISPDSSKPDSIKNEFEATYEVSKETIKKEEKQIDDEVSHLKKSYDDLAKLTNQVSFDKCKTTDDFKLEKEILKNEERRFGEEAESLRRSYEDLTKITEEVTFDKCHADFKAQEVAESQEKQIDGKVDHLRENFEDLEKLNESVVFEKCKSPEEFKVDKDSMEKEKEDTFETGIALVEKDMVDSNKADHLAHLTESSKKVDKIEMKDSSSIFERKEDSTEVTKVETKDSLTHLDDKPVTSQVEKCEKERMEKTQFEEEPSKLQVVSPEPKKLSISDVEISLKTELDHKDVIQSFLDNEKSFVCDSTDAKICIAPKEGDVCQKDESSKVEVKESTETEPSSNKSSPEVDLSGKVTPPTVPLSPISKDLRSPLLKLDSGMSEQTETDEEDLSTKSQIAHSQSDLDELDMKMDPMGMSFYGALPDEQFQDEGDVPATYLYEITKAKFSSPSKTAKGDAKVVEEASTMSASFIGELPSSSIDSKPSSDTKEMHSKDAVDSWGKPLGLPAPTHLYEVTKAKFSSRREEENLMTSSFIGDHLPTSSQRHYEDPMTTSVYFGDDDDHPAASWEEQSNLQRKEEDPMTASVYFGNEEDPIASWGKPLGLPSPAPPNNNDKGTPKKERKLPAHVTAKNKLNDDRKRAESPSKMKNKKVNAVYVDLTYVPHHGNHYYSYVDFFKRIRARYYVFSGLEPSRQVYDALLEAKQTWEDKELEVTIIPTYDTDILGYWVAENEELLSKFKIDLAPSASRCTINLQDHETSCSAYRLEF